MSLLARRDLSTIESEILDYLKVEDVNSSLRLIIKLVEEIGQESPATGLVYGSKVLDELCIKIANTIKFRNIENGKLEEDKKIVFIASLLSPYGGHTLIIEDIIKHLNGKNVILIVTDLFHNVDQDFVFRKFSQIAEVKICSPGTYQEKLFWLINYLSNKHFSEIFLFNHHQDAVAITSVVPFLIEKKVLFYHHADHHLCLGLHLPNVIHLDPHNIGYFNCRNSYGLDNYYLPIFVVDKGMRDARISFLQEKTLTTCTSGTSNKFMRNYRYSYAKLICKRLQVRPGIHIHIGDIPESFLEHIQAKLSEEGVDKSRFVHISRVDSVWSTLIDLKVDLYIASFPVGGGRASIEAMGSGTPLLMHESYLSRSHGGVDLAYPEAYVWKNESEFESIIKSITSFDLKKHSNLARNHYEQNHLPSRFSLILNSIFSNLNVHQPPQLRHYENDELESYLLMRYEMFKVFKSAHDVEIQNLHSTIAALKASKSWTLTKPLRWISSKLKR